MAAPDQSSSNSMKKSGDHLNPITGQIEPEVEESPFKNMTDEEKEREAERLFVLFEKLNSSGIIKATFNDNK